MSNATVTEALARLEHKVDIVLKELTKLKGGSLLIPQVGAFSHVCPICNQQVSYYVDPVQKVIIRKCGCKTGLSAPIDLEAFAPPTTKRKEDARDDEDEEDRSNAYTGGRPGRPRGT